MDVFIAIVTVASGIALLVSMVIAFVHGLVDGDYDDREHDHHTSVNRWLYELGYETVARRSRIAAERAEIRSKENN